MLYCSREQQQTPAICSNGPLSVHPFTLQEAKNAAESFMLKEAQLTQWSVRVNHTSLQDAEQQEKSSREKMRSLEQTLEAEK